MGTGESTSGTYDLKVRGWYRVARGAIGILLRVLSRLDVQGREEIPAHGAYILVTNHLHWLDSPVVAVILPHRAYVFAGEKWEKHWLLGPFFHSLGAIFVRRGEVDRQALRQALAVLQGGGVLGMAPEGTRSKTGGLQRGRTGAAYLAYRAGVPVYTSSPGDSTARIAMSNASLTPTVMMHSLNGSYEAPKYVSTYSQQALRHSVSPRFEV